MFRNLFKPTLATAAIALAACGGTEEAPIRDSNLRELGSFEIEFRPDGTSTIRSDLYNQLTFAEDGNPNTNPPETIQARTTSAIVGNDENGCASGLNCFVVELRNFTSNPLNGVYMGIDSISGGGGRALVSPDPVPTGVTALLNSGRNFGAVAVNATSTRNMDFTIPNANSYLVRGRYWGDDGAVTKSYSGPVITVNNSSQYGRGLPVLNFTTGAGGDFPTGARVRDINVRIQWYKVLGTDCSVGAGSAGNVVNRSTGFRLVSPAGTQVVLVHETTSPAPTIGPTYNSTPSVLANVVFDQDSANQIPSAQNGNAPGAPTSGTFQPSDRPGNNNLDSVVNQLPGGNWRIGASSDGTTNHSVCVVDYSMTILAN